MDALPGQRGFTLLELALTMLIVGIVLAMAVPRLPSLGSTELETSADRLAATMTYLADEASLRGRIYRLTIDFAESRWTVAALAPFAAADTGAAKAEFREDEDDDMARSTRLPDGVTFDAVVDPDGETTTGSRALFFLPEGATDSIDLRLAGRDGSTVEVLFDPALGSAHRESSPAGTRK